VPPLAQLTLAQAEVALRAHEFKHQFPPGLVVARSYQLCLPTVPHRYLLAEGPGALYVAFLGTKQPRDLLADANARQAPFQEAAASAAAAALPLPRVHAGRR